jgi:hypothetical protein
LTWGGGTDDTVMQPVNADQAETNVIKLVESK